MTGGLDSAGKVTPIVTLEIPQGHANDRAKVLDVRQAGCLADEFFLLTDNRIKFFDLPKSGSQILQLLGTFARVTAQRIQAVLDVNGVAESRAVLLEQSRVGLAAKLIEGTALGRLPRQTNLVGLPVDRHHGSDNVRQDRGRHGTGTEVGTGTTCGTHRTADDQLASFDEATAVLNACCNLFVHREDTVNGKALCATAHERRIRAGTEQQLQAREHHRLTGTRFAGHNDEPRPKIDVSGLDNTQMRNIERLNHRGPSLHPRTGRLNLRTRRAENGVSSMRTS